MEKTEKVFVKKWRLMHVFQLLLYYIIRLCIYLTGSQSPFSVIEAVQGLKIVGDEEYVKVFSVCYGV
jgi:steroid 5-alpha reductase family enzyme